MDPIVRTLDAPTPMPRFWPALTVFLLTAAIGAVPTAAQVTRGDSETVGDSETAGDSESAGDATPSGAATSGLSGTVRYDGDGDGPFLAIELTAECAAMHLGPVPQDTLMLGNGNTLGNVFVRIVNPPAGDYEPPSQPVVIDQNGCLYRPRVVGVMVGQPLRFTNADLIEHTVHGWPTESREFTIGMPPALPADDRVFNEPEPLFAVTCDIHPWMTSYVAVMTHPYFAVTAPDGRFMIDGLPDGTYEIEAWHETLPAQHGRATVRNGRASVDLSFPSPGPRRTRRP